MSILSNIAALSGRADRIADRIEKAKGHVPPETVRNNAKRGLELRRKYGRGGLTNSEASDQGIGSGVQRASNLANGSALSLDTIKRMRAFFERHEKNKDTPPEEGNGKIAWLLWGGDAGRAWANSILRQEDLLKRIDALSERLSRVAKEAPAPGDVHVPSTEWGQGPKKKKKPAPAADAN